MIASIWNLRYSWYYPWLQYTGLCMHNRIGYWVAYASRKLYIELSPQMMVGVLISIMQPVGSPEAYQIIVITHDRPQVTNRGEFS